MSAKESNEFLDFLARQTTAEEALIHGKVEPRLELWTRRDPVSLLGAARASTAGWAELEAIFRWVADVLGRTPKRDFRYDVEVAEVSEDGKMAYSVGFERFTEVREDGSERPWIVRVTHVYRREDGEWKIVHRHGSIPPPEELFR